MFSARQLHIALKTTYLQRLGHAYSNQTHIHPTRVRAFASTPRIEVTEHPTFKNSPLFQQIATNPSALVSRHGLPSMILLINVTACSERVWTVYEGARFADAAFDRRNMYSSLLPHTYKCGLIVGVSFSPDRPPSTMQLFGLMVNPAFRKGVQKLREDLANAGVNVDPEVCTRPHYPVSHLKGEVRMQWRCWTRSEDKILPRHEP